MCFSSIVLFVFFCSVFVLALPFRPQHRALLRVERLHAAACSDREIHVALVRDRFFCESEGEKEGFLGVSAPRWFQLARTPTRKTNTVPVLEKHRSPGTNAEQMICTLIIICHRFIFRSRPFCFLFFRDFE